MDQKDIMTRAFQLSSVTLPRHEAPAPLILTHPMKSVKGQNWVNIVLMHDNDIHDRHVAQDTLLQQSSYLQDLSYSACTKLLAGRAQPARIPAGLAGEVAK